MNPNIEKLLNGFLMDEDISKGYALYINDRRFKTRKGKKVWNTPHAAKAAFRVAFKWYVKNAVKNEFFVKGIGDFYRHDEYKNCWENFLKEIKIEIRELK